MRKPRILAALLLGSALVLGGCGVTYISPTVKQQAAGMDVRVVQVTRDSARAANSAPYTPRSLPEYFRQNAGGGSLRGAGALPPAPVTPDLRPGRLELRPPEAAPESPYHIGVGDTLRLATRTAVPGTETGLDEQAVTTNVLQQYTVRDDGAVGIPEIGPVNIAGKTIEEAEALLFRRFIEAGLDPSFSLEVSGFNSQRVTVGGEVRNPTVVPVRLTQPTLEEALTAAGGLAVSAPEYASIRIYRDGTLYQIPLSDYRETPRFHKLTLATGDAVFVDSSYDLDRAFTYYQQQIQVSQLRRGERSAALNELSAEINLRRDALDEQRALFAKRTELDGEERDYVYLAGEVKEQSRWPLPYGHTASLADALYANGGFDVTTGNPGQIYVLRASESEGQVTAWHLDAANAANITLATKFEMRPDDIVFVQEQPITRWNRALQQFFPFLLNQANSAIN